MAKRIICLFLAFLGICSLISGCNNTQEAPTTTTESKSMNIMQKSDPAQDDSLNVLMIGNSFCYYYAEELYGMLTAAGYENVNICNVYYSGCTMEQHWKWWKNNESNYQYFTANENGRDKVINASLEYCLKQRNWDIISLQESGAKFGKISAQEVLANTQIYHTDLWGYIKEQFPMSRYFWHQTWSNQIGYTHGSDAIETLAQQDDVALANTEFSLLVCEQYDLERVNSGEAWQITRHDGYDNMCAMLAVNNGEGDYYHDGDIGGGQYLNACVWFEIITGKSCIDNTYRPNYALNEALIPTLQEAAHKAVSQRNS